MKILVVTNPKEDYLADGILHGFRSIFKDSAIDYPHKKVMYTDFQGSNIYGNGFTLFKTLENIGIDRSDIPKKIKSHYFDLIILSSLHRQISFIKKFYKYLNYKNTIVIDGEDETTVVKNVDSFFKKYSIKKFCYFKRELNIADFNKPNIKPISFCIPKEKIFTGLAKKTQKFPQYIVDKKIALKINKNSSSYIFSKESNYYDDLRKSQFGITTRKAGWDALRHYEIAMNRAIICFRDLNEKPLSYAPHGLTHGVNCLSYSHYDDLEDKISTISPEQYNLMLENTNHWILKNTTEFRAEYILRTFKNL